MEMKVASQIIILLNWASCCFLCRYTLLQFEFDCFTFSGEGGQITQISAPCLKRGPSNKEGLPEHQCQTFSSSSRLLTFWPLGHSLPGRLPSPILSSLRPSLECSLTCPLTRDPHTHIAQDRIQVKWNNYRTGIKDRPDLNSCSDWGRSRKDLLFQTVNWPAHR